MVLNQCQKEGGRRPSAERSPGPDARLVSIPTGLLRCLIYASWKKKIKNLSFCPKKARWKRGFASSSSVEIPRLILYGICCVGWAPCWAERAVPLKVSPQPQWAALVLSGALPQRWLRFPGGHRRACRHQVCIVLWEGGAALQNLKDTITFVGYNVLFG